MLQPELELNTEIEIPMLTTGVQYSRVLEEWSQFKSSVRMELDTIRQELVSDGVNKESVMESFTSLVHSWCHSKDTRSKRRASQDPESRHHPQGVDQGNDDVTVRTHTPGTGENGQGITLEARCATTNASGGDEHQNVAVALTAATDSLNTGQVTETRQLIVHLEPSTIPAPVHLESGTQDHETTMTPDIDWETLQNVFGTDIHFVGSGDFGPIDFNWNEVNFQMDDNTA